MSYKRAYGVERKHKPLRITSSPGQSFLSELAKLGRPSALAETGADCAKQLVFLIWEIRTGAGGAAGPGSVGAGKDDQPMATAAPVCRQSVVDAISGV